MNERKRVMRSITGMTVCKGGVAIDFKVRMESLHRTFSLNGWGTEFFGGRLVVAVYKKSCDVGACTALVQVGDQRVASQQGLATTLVPSVDWNRHRLSHLLIDYRSSSRL
jgi:hypothetical protein